MNLRRPVLLRMVGSVFLVGLLALNGWLVALNLAKHDRLPAVLEDLPGLAGAVADNEDVAVGSADPAVVGDGEAAAFNANGSVPPGSADIDDWPGGRGPVPDGQATGRRVLVAADGGLRVVGSAPRWSVVTDMVDDIARRLGRDPAAIAVDVVWHPEASARLSDGEVVLEQPLRYEAGQIEPSDDGAVILAPVVALLTAHPELYVVVVGLVDETDAGGEQAAVALGRTTVVTEELVASGIAPERVVASVASVGAEERWGPAGGQVVVRIENLLVFGPGD